MGLRTNKRHSGTPDQDHDFFGAELSFAAKEAYKLLRTNLMFALSDMDEDRGHIVGITSSLRGEGKSTTVLNLAKVLAEQGKLVIVVEGDLRLPTLRKKLKTRGNFGLTNALINRDDPLKYAEEYRVGEVDGRPICFHLLPAGEIPPNPSELLGSHRMEEVLRFLALEYDFVLLDLPPVTAVADALVATKMVDGVLMVVRNEHADTGSLGEAIRQLQQVGGKILGFAYTCAGSSGSGYKSKYKYKAKYKYGAYDYAEYQ